MRGRKALRFWPWPNLMAGADPRNAALHRNCLQEDANISFAREAMTKGKLVVKRNDAALQAALSVVHPDEHQDVRDARPHQVGRGCLGHPSRRHGAGLHARSAATRPTGPVSFFGRGA